MPEFTNLSDPSQAGHYSRTCPICGTPSNKAKTYLNGNYDPARLTEFSFASRKDPEYMCHHMVQCLECDLVYVTAPPTSESLKEAYHRASYDSNEEADDAAAAYAKAIAPALRKLANRTNALEIGTGTGIFLEHLREYGFQDVIGIEPSRAAILAAPDARQKYIREGVFIEADFRPESFDLVCCFMTLEHVRDPSHLANSVMRLLRPGGVFVTVTHDYKSIVNRVLGKRSPIIDIEHMQLFSRPSIDALFVRSGYRAVSVSSFVNRYQFSYWTRLAPIPAPVKAVMGSLFQKRLLPNLRFGINVGNMIAYGYKSS
jgi:SAM-dependent methyltransferase